MKKGIFGLIIFIILALVVWRIVENQYAKRRVEKKETAATEVSTEKVRRDVISKTIQYSGNIAGVEQVNIYPMEETGRLLRYLVKEGDRVSKGSVIALVDRSIKGLNYKPATIISPISGIVGMLFLDKGAAVAPQIPVAMIANMSKLKVKIQISEEELKIAKKGQEAIIRVDMYSDTTFSGILKDITPVINPLSRTATGEIIMNNSHHLLKPGMFARVQLVVEKHTDAIVVPEKAIIRRGEKEIVFTKMGDVAKKKDVKIGIKSNDMIEVVEGLDEGEEVIVSGNYGLRDDVKIFVKKNNKLGGQQ